MSRSPPARRRPPQLLALVYVLSLLLVLVTAGGLSSLVSNDVRATAIASSVESDLSLVHAFVTANLTDLELAGVIAPDRLPGLERQLDALIGNGIVRVNVFGPDGTILFSDREALRGQNFGIGDHLADALAGTPHAEIETNIADGESELTGYSAAIEEYLPITLDGRTVAVFEVYRDAAPVLAQVDRSQAQVLVVTVLAGAILALMLYVLFRSSDRMLKRQTDQILDATRRDALTGMLTHGEIVARLTTEIAGAGEGQQVGMALIDMDNFGLLNDAHGHDAGDQILREVAGLLRSELSQASVIGRYGPDEFLAVAPPSCVHDLEAGVQRLRLRLTDLAPRFGDSEELPITVSAGMAIYPLHGRAATELLSLATVALGQAKQGGGDQVRRAEPVGDDIGVERASFDVLQGLVIAVDNKDRYTKRHSEDVARYAVFLAERLDLPPTLRRTIHLAGLLHDVGKIGVPDSILRKPARLTTEEYSIVQQHVALGHMIVRDLPDLDHVKAGIRHHHEQWNGRGYLDGLVGEEIPLVARILAVADAFSAMTTTRPYRKALSVKEALLRIEDAADSQLDPAMVTAFVHGMATAADAPMPMESGVALLWEPPVATGQLVTALSRSPQSLPGAAAPPGTVPAN